MVKAASSFQNWKISQKYIRIGHNREVELWFREAGSAARFNLRHSLKIYPKDTAAQCQAKMTYFKNYVDFVSREVLSLPLAMQTKTLTNRPQLAIVFRSTEPKSRSGNYTLHIPHYNGDRTPRITAHTKGNYWAIYRLKDGSPLKAYCSTATEAERTVREMIKLVNKRYLPDTKQIATGEIAHKPFKKLRVRPVRADYYPEGHHQGSVPKWRYYFK